MSKTVAVLQTTRVRAIAFAVVFAMAAVGSSAAQQPNASNDCSAPPPEPITMIDVPGNPFQALPSADGCWIFVSMPGGPQRGSSKIGVLRRAGGKITLDHVMPIDGNPTGMVLTHDGRTLIVADGQRVAFIDAEKLVKTRANAVLGYLDEPGRLGRIYANVTSDDKSLFVADENAETISVIDLAKIRASRFHASSVVGKIPTGALPIALTFSADEKFLYTTSQWAPKSLNWPLECKREGAVATDTTPVNPQGAILIVDVERAQSDPAHSVIGAVPAGCSTVRLVLSPSGDRAYVTARNSNALLVFDTAKLRSDPAHARLASVTLGTAPVGIAVIDSGRKIVVTNSNRFAGSSSDRQTLTVVDAAKIGSGDAAILGSIPAGAFPREMRATSDGAMLLLTNFTSRSVEAIDLTRLPLATPASRQTNNVAAPTATFRARSARLR
jgi:DNA-binding beta-propeller fold protein YncE